MSELTDKLRNSLNKHSDFVSKVFVIGLWVTAIMMFIIMLLGLFKIGVGLILEFDFIKSIKADENKGLIQILRGLEFIFVSPLFYLLLSSLIRYISAIRPNIDLSLDEKKKYMNHAMMEITNVKILNTGLFISILVLHCLSFILQDTAVTPPIVFIICLFAVLIVYYFVIDKLVEKLR